MPERLDLWRQYRDVRKKSLKEKGTIEDATEFYRLNRSEMDRGFVISSPGEMERGMLSAEQFVMDTWARNESKFFTEQQNDPDSARYACGGFLTPKTVTDKQAEHQRFHVPPESVLLTAHVDVGKHVLWYCVTAWGPELKFGHVVDYGVYPQQGTPFFRKDTPPISIQDYYEDGDEFSKVKAALIDMFEIIFEQQYFCDGKEININKLSNLTHFGTKKPLSFLGLCGVDASDGNYETTIWQAAIESKYRDRIIPAYGTSSRSKGRLLRHVPPRLGESKRAGVDWICNPESRKKTLAPGIEVTSLLYDANTFKTLINSALLTSLENDGTLTLFHGTKETHDMIANHLCSEEYIRGKRGMTEYDEWKMKKPQVADNDLWDALVGTAAIASFCGIESASATAPAPVKQKTTKFSELQKKTTERRFR